MNGRVAALVAAGVLSVSTSASAQNLVAQTQVAPGVVPAGTGVVADPALAAGRPLRLEPPRFGRDVEHSVGARFWVWSTPVWMVGIFAHVASDWSGATSFSPGLEYVYHKGLLDIVTGFQYTSLATPSAGLVRGNAEQDIALERIDSHLWTLTANVLFLYTSRINDWFEIQYGAGVGASFVGGDLYRTQVTPDSAGPLVDTNGAHYSECTAAQRGRTAYCDASNQHYANTDGTRFSEPRLTSSPSGSIPPVVPWVSLPHIALHFRPHRHFDVRVDGGYAIIGFYGGLAMHYVF